MRNRIRFYFFVIAVGVCSGCYHTDKQVVNAFVSINQSLADADRMIEANNQSIYIHFQKALEQDHLQAWPHFGRATKAKELSDSLVNYIQRLKVKLVKEVDGVNNYTDDTLKYIGVKEAISSATRVLISGPNSEATLLRIRISEYRKKMIGLLNMKVMHDTINFIISSVKDTAEIHPGLLTSQHVDENGKQLSWEEYNFANVPFVADIAQLTRIQVEVRSTEGEFIRFFYYNLPASNSGW